MRSDLAILALAFVTARPRVCVSLVHAWCHFPFPSFGYFSQEGFCTAAATEIRERFRSHRTLDLSLCRIRLPHEGPLHFIKIAAEGSMPCQVLLRWILKFRPFVVCLERRRLKSKEVTMSSVPSTYLNASMNVEIRAVSFLPVCLIRTTMPYLLYSFLFTYIILCPYVCWRTTESDSHIRCPGHKWQFPLERSLIVPSSCLKCTIVITIYILLQRLSLRICFKKMPGEFDLFCFDHNVNVLDHTAMFACDISSMLSCRDMNDFCTLYSLFCS